MLKEPLNKVQNTFEPSFWRMPESSKQLFYWMLVFTSMTVKTLLQSFLNTQHSNSDRILEHKSPLQFIDGQPVGDRIHGYTPPTEHDVDL